MSLILFVDDDPLTLDTLTRAVQVLGHQAISANNGQQAIALAEQQHPDLVFIDMMLPDMQGLALVEILHKQATTSQIPLFMLSAGPEVEVAEKARQAGARDFISKPIRLQALLDIIQEYTTT